MYITFPRFHWLHFIHQNRARGARDRSNPPKWPQKWVFWLNLSKKVKFHLFCINLDTGYLLYVVLWIPKAFSLITHHPRIVFTICKKWYLDGHYNLQFFYYVKSEFSFKIKNIYIDSDFSTSNSQVYHYFEKKDY